MGISVVVSTYSTERCDYVLRCIDSVKSQTVAPSEIVLALDNDERLIDFYISRVPASVKIAVSCGTGLSNARNAGIQESRGEIVAFIDDDAVAETDWLKRLVSNYDDDRVYGVGGRILPIWEDGCPDWYPEELYWIVGCSYKGLPERSSLVRNPIGCNMSFRKEVFERIGYFRPDIGRVGKWLLASEETELSMRMVRGIPGSRIVYDPSAVVYHSVGRQRTGLVYLFKRSFLEGVSKALIAKWNKDSQGLSTERHYLQYLVRVGLGMRIRHTATLRCFWQLWALLISVIAVATGFAFGQIKKLFSVAWGDWDNRILFR